MKFWVYIHINKINGKRYVGVTKQKSPSKRWLNGKGYSHSPHLNSAIQKYGWQNFDHIVYEVGSLSEMYYLEKYLIRYYQTRDRRFGYNICEGGELNIGNKWTDERKETIRGQKNNVYLPGVIDKIKQTTWSQNKAIAQYDLDGNLIKIWPSLRLIEKEGIAWRRGVAKCCKGKAYIASGYKWKYYETDIP